MTWSTSDLNTGTIFNDGTGAFNMKASGTIYAGQAMFLCDDDQVKVTTSTAGECESIGIASINSSDGDYVGVYGYGNIVRCCMASNYSVYTPLYATTDGVLTSTAGNAKKVAGYNLEVPSLGNGGTNYVGKVMLV